MAGSILGAAVKRAEDPRFIRGKGRFIPNLPVDGALWMVPVRSPLAHGRILGVDPTLAASLPGVVGVFTASDLALGPGAPGGAGVDRAYGRPPLAEGKVRFVGEVVAAVVAETEAAAVDAAAMVFTDIEPLPAVVSPEQAMAAGAPLLFPATGTNVVRAGTIGNPDAVPAGADVRIRLQLHNQRVAAVPMEPNSAVAIPSGDRLELWVGSQNVFGHRNQISRAVGFDRDAIHALAPDVGGGFGAKFYTYPEQVIVARLALLLGAPVRWHESRRGNLVSMTQGRAQHIDIELLATSAGLLTGLHMDIVQDVGAYPLYGAAIPDWTGHMAAGAYAVPAVDIGFRCVVTNTTPIHAYRGAGRPEATHAVERAMDVLAAEVGIDPVEIRRRNFIAPEDFPYTAPTGAIYDSGDYGPALDAALGIAGYDTLRAEQRRRREGGDRVQIGIGLACYVEVTAPETNPREWGAVDVDGDGTVTVRVGTSAHGQGHETAFAQLASATLGIPMDEVRVLQADTDVVPRGAGTGGSRSLQLAGSALVRASDEVLAKARRIVAAHLEASADDIVAGDGVLGVAGVPGAAMTWAEVARAAATGVGLEDGEDASLAAEVTFEQGRPTYPFGTHLAVTEVDTETGSVRLVRHIAVDDCGTVLNPLLVAGQVHGGVAQGAGQALFEQVVYDEDGNPLTGSLASYLMPTAGSLPSVERRSTETPTPHNPLGAKGIGEAATIGSTPAIHNAVMDALAHLGVKHVDMPLVPGKVWEALKGAQM